MENSILDKIISNHKAEEVAKLNAVEIVNNLFSELSERERDILTRRFGLHGQGRETLETAGNAHQLTRERIRQIEVASIKKLRELKRLEEYVDVLKNVINQLLDEHGGIMERDYLLKLLVDFSFDSDSDREKDKEVHKNYLHFLISKLLHDHFEEVNGTGHFKEAYKTKYHNLEYLEEILTELLSKIEEAKKIYKTDELISLLKELESFQKHKEKFDIDYNIDISKVLGSDLYDEKPEIINPNKALYSLLVVARKIEQNKFGHWGMHNAREIKPKTINDKIYLVLKNHNKPLHFVEIAERINKIGFDKKQANAATVHNELILDKKYVLVGRGLYGLKEWGYKKGTVTDVIKDVLEASDGPVSRDEIIDKVLDKRVVKKTTIILALMNKDIFTRVGDKYRLKNRD